MKNQSQADANIITQLREQISITGNTTMSKLHTIVANHELNGPSRHTAHTSNAQATYHNRQIDELNRRIAE